MHWPKLHFFSGFLSTMLLTFLSFSLFLMQQTPRAIVVKCDGSVYDVDVDGSALGNPGPTGAGAVVYLKGYNSSPILLKKGVSPLSNNYTGELVGILIALKFMVSLDDQIQLKDRKIHFFTDCQPAIIAAFNSSIPRPK